MGRTWNRFKEIMWTEERLNGKWDWWDLANVNSIINAIEGSDRREQAKDGQFQIGDLTSAAGIIDAIRGSEREKTEDNATDWIRNLLGLGENKNKIEKKEDDDGNNPEGSTGNNPEGSTGSNPEGSTGSNPEGSTGSNPEGSTGTSPEIKDETDTNIEQNLSYMEWADQKIAEQREREDTAYQRAVKDMQKAGINPNLMNVQPAASSAGSTGGMEGIESMLEELDIILDKETTIEENTKDRISSLIGTVLMAVLFKKVR